MNRRNYARELTRIIDKCAGNKPRVLLHCCCGPCATSVLEYLTKFFEVTVLWYNPNLYPEEEYNRRCYTLEEVIDKLGYADCVQVISEPWRHEDYCRISEGLENEKEGGARCTECFRIRLEETARLAKQYGFDYFCSTLTVSRHKNAELINAIGEETAKEYGVSWLPSDFKKNDGENRSVEISEQLGIYRQKYCGCEFSLDARNRGKDENP